MRILALDPATVTGWAFADMNNFQPPAYGVRLFRKRPKDHPGQRFNEYKVFLHELIMHYAPEIIYYEHPLFPGKRSSRHNLVVGFGYEAILHMVTSQYGIKCVPVHPSTLKKWATGYGRAEKGDMIVAATGFTGVKLRHDQDNEADALCLLVYAAQDQEVYASQDQEVETP